MAQCSMLRQINWNKSAARHTSLMFICIRILCRLHSPILNVSTNIFRQPPSLPYYSPMEQRFSACLCANAYLTIQMNYLITSFAHILHTHTHRERNVKYGIVVEKFTEVIRKSSTTMSGLNNNRFIYVIGYGFLAFSISET